MKLEPISNEIVDASQESYLLDYQGKGELLAICFGFCDAAGVPQFDFYKRLKKLEVLSGKKINKLLLSDKSNSWYHYGIEGLGKDADETTVAIKNIIGEINPSQVITIGQSMGGYAALVYGALLEVDKAISFGPLSCFEAEKLEVLRDYRWLELIKKVQSSAPKVFYSDLAELLKKKSKTQFEIFYGTNPGENADRLEAVNYDAAHALRLYGLNGVKLFPLHNSPHAIVEYMRLNKIIDDALLNRIFNLQPQTKNIADTGLSSEWSKWLEENIRLGCSDKQLSDSLMQNNFNTETAKAAIAQIHAKYDLARILDKSL